MKFSFPSVAALVTLALPGFPVSCQALETTKTKNLFLRTTRELDADDDQESVAGPLEDKTESPPHQGCELLLKDTHPPQPMLVGKDFEMTTTTDYSVDNEAGATAAECKNGMAGGYPCNNVDLLSMLDNAALSTAIGGGSQTANDVWGWTDAQSGREFAMIGLKKGTAFVEITDPHNPIYVGGLPTQGGGSSWRDIKTMDHYAVIVSEEGGHGMQIFDLRQLLNASPGTTFENTARYTGIGSAHNIFVNEDTEFAYIVGQSNCSGGLHMVDLSSPANPTFAGCYSADGYTHDVQCVVYGGPDTIYRGKEICFASNEDTVTIVDVSDKSNPVQISRTGYSARYTHQGWLTEDHAYFIFNDELDEYYGTRDKTSTHVMKVNILSNPQYQGFHEGRTKAIDHNNYVLGDHVYQANYRAGLNILKINNLTTTPEFDEVGHFDIYPGSDSNRFNGMWSNYPYFPSGTIVASGIEQGLFMLKFTGGASTPSPTTLPPTNPPPSTSAPTLSPVQSPSGCEGSDSTAHLMWEGEKRKCNFTKESPSTCNTKAFKKHCPHTCDTCKFKCKDVRAEFYLSKKSSAEPWTCEQVAGLSAEKREKKCLREKIYTTCRKTCGFCS